MKTAENITIEDDPLYVPNEQEWSQMSSSQRQEKEESIIAALEQEFNLMGETTIHFNARASATEVLRRYYANKGQKVFIASDLHTLYPGEKAFYPDLLIVFEVDAHHRRSWNVHSEKKGLDFALEIISKGSRRNDLVEKLNLYARLGIPEYFIFDPDNYKLTGYTLQIEDNFQHYQKISSVADDGVFSSILGLQLILEGYQLRFVSADGLEVPYGDELITRLNDKLMSKNAVIADERKQKIHERKQKELEIELKEQEIELKEQEKLRADKLEEKVKELELLLKQAK
jgi:Uma2 family endonuclease